MAIPASKRECPKRSLRRASRKTGRADEEAATHACSGHGDEAQPRADQQHGGHRADGRPVRDAQNIGAGQWIAEERLRG